MRLDGIGLALTTLAVVASSAVFAPPAHCAGAAAAAANLPNGKALYDKTCMACHGQKAEGKRDIQSPALHAQEPWYIVAQLEKFRSGMRGTNPKDASGAAMRPIALMLPDAQSLRDVAEYIATLDAPPTPREVAGDAVAGAKAYKTVCAACHGDGGKGKPEVKSPALTGQSDWYLAMQLQKFKDGHRGWDAKDVTGSQMRAMALTLANEKAVKDVVSYIATLK